jgi:UDP-glucose 4-epimerase
MLSSIVGYSRTPEYQQPREGDVKHSLADISQAHEAMGYRPSVGFEEGLRRTVDWYKHAVMPAQVSA